jgi:3-deoxy-D-manno-octulosonic-acid transferase
MTFLFYLSLFFYQIIIYFFSFFVRISALWNSKHKQWVDGRNGIFEKIQKTIQPGEKRIWIHCSSLGEFEQGRPVIEQLKKDYPEYKIFLTFFSPSGYEIRKNYAQTDYVFYLPGDTIKNVRKFIKIVDPRVVIFVKYEFWYNYLTCIRKQNIPLILISAIFQKDKVFFQPWGILFRKMLGKFDHIFVQDEQSLKLLSTINLPNVSIAPDTRIDRVLQISNEAWKSDIHEVEEFCAHKHVLIAGSSYATEEEYIFKLLQNPEFEWKVIIAPHNIEKDHIDKIRLLFEGKAVFWSDLKSSDERIQLDTFSILIIDSIGLLAHLYKYASVAFIGGGFGKSIHNILEPATFGLPIIIGPNNHAKFKEATDLINLGGVTLVNNYSEFESDILSFKNDDMRSYAGSISRKYIIDNSGGTKIIIEFLGKYL